MPFLVLPVVLQIVLVFHIVKTKRDTRWIWIVVMLPVAGSVVYLLLEVAPDLWGSRTGRNVRKNIEGVVNPNKNINAASRDLEIADTVENSVVLAEECLNKGLFEDAQKLFERCLRGIYKDSPDIMFGLARAEFGLNNYDRAKEVLDDLIKKNPDYKNSSAHLYYARTVEGLNDIDLALQEYEVLHGYYPGSEASYRYALLLKKAGRMDAATDILDEILNKSRLAGKHYNTVNKEWISLAIRERKNMLNR